MEGSKLPIGYGVRCTAEGNTDAGLRFKSFLFSKHDANRVIRAPVITPSIKLRSTYYLI